MNNKANKHSWASICAIVLIITLVILVYFNPNDLKLIIKNFDLNLAHRIVSIMFFLLIFGVLFYVLRAIYYNWIVKPKKETLYLKSINKNVCVFLDASGNRFNNSPDNYSSLVVGKYYDVTKTKNMVWTVDGVSMESFPVPKERIYYWFNWYTPFYNFENILILPVIYMGFFMGLLSSIESKQNQKWIGIGLMFIIGILLLYDLVYKINLRKKIDYLYRYPEKDNPNNNPLPAQSDEQKLLIGMELIAPTVMIIIGITSVISGISFFKRSEYLSFQIISIVFILVTAIFTIKSIGLFFKVINGLDDDKKIDANAEDILAKFSKMSNLLNKILVILFLIMWFALIIFCTYISISRKIYWFLILVAFFWVFGFVVIYKYFMK